jgi:hypothetical protein
VLDGAADRVRQLLDVDRLGDEVVGAGAQGLHRDVHAAVAGDHDDRQLGVDLEQLLREVDAAVLAEPDVDHRGVEVGGARVVEGAGGVARRLDLVTATLERGGQEVARVVIVVDEKDVSAHG